MAVLKLLLASAILASLFSSTMASRAGPGTLVIQGSFTEYKYLRSSPYAPGFVCQPATMADGTTAAVLIKDAAYPWGSWSPRSKWVGDATLHVSACDASVFINETAPDSPSAADRLTAQQWAALSPGHWIVAKRDLDDLPWTPLLAVGSCAFTVGAAPEDRLPWGFGVGSADVRDLLANALQYQSGREGVVGVRGNMPCVAWTNDGSYATKVPINWKIMNRDEVVGWFKGL